MSNRSDSPYFKVISKSKTHFGRIAELTSRSGKIITPTFIPDATRGAVKGLTPNQVLSTGVQMVLCNTYHLHNKPGEETISDLGGIHKFTRWGGPIMTDSGGFQVFSLSKINKITEDGVIFKDPATNKQICLTPEKSIGIQFKLGSDIMVAFDDVTALDQMGRKRETDAFERTHRWLDRSIAEFKRLTKNLEVNKRPLLFGVVQGGLNKSLRKRSLNLVQDSEVDGIAIGGLSVGESKSELRTMLEFLAPLYDEKRPHFLLGVGDPTDVRYAIEYGIDLLDCVLPTRNARHGSAWITGDKAIHFTNKKYINNRGVIDKKCDCTTCLEGFSTGFLNHQFKSKEPLAGSLASIHNLRYLIKITDSYKK